MLVVKNLKNRFEAQSWAARGVLIALLVVGILSVPFLAGFIVAFTRGCPYC